MCLSSKIDLSRRVAGCEARRTLLEIRASALAENALRCREPARLLFVGGVVKAPIVHWQVNPPRYK
jgi:hypothetical protein